MARMWRRSGRLNCGTTALSSFPNNSPVADFFCASCSEEFELKSKKGKFSPKLANGSFKTKCERLAASNNPNFFLMNYDLTSLVVVNLFIVPKHYFVREIVEERKPLAPTARRAGWIGSNILLGRVPESGKIHIVQNGMIRDRDVVLAEDEVYAFDRRLGQLYPGNQNVRPKIRQQLQYLRDRGFIKFVSRGNYRVNT